MLLTYHILVQAGLDLVWRRNVLNIQNRLFSLLLFFLLQLLLIGNSAVSLKISQVHETDIGESALLSHLIHFLLEIGITEHALVIKLAYRIHGLVHTVITDTDIVGHLEHFTGLALRPAADEADILIFTVITLTCLGSIRGILFIGNILLTGVFC